jgi:hypothetical protein
MVRPRDVALGVAGAVVLLIGPAPADVAGLFRHPAPACTSGCGHTDAWWDRPVLVAHADELPATTTRGLAPLGRGQAPGVRSRPRPGPAAPHRRLPG